MQHTAVAIVLRSKAGLPLEVGSSMQSSGMLIAIATELSIVIFSSRLNPENVLLLQINDTG